MRTCRFCHKRSTQPADRDLIKYGPRHYAHPRCLVKAQGPDALLNLPLWVLETRVPYALLKEYPGVLDVIESRHRAVRRIIGEGM